MKVLVQRSYNAKCLVDNKVVGESSKGLVIFVGFTEGDNIEKIKYLVNKIINLRIFEDENKVMNKSILEIEGTSILSISQFTLYADCKKGNRPSFTTAMAFDKANDMYLKFCDSLKESGVRVEMGVFGADMKIDFVNDGPVTIILDSDSLK